MPEWPRLSETLSHPRTLVACQACGRGELPSINLAVWQEHDEADRPEPIFLVLCDACARLIEPHPRLYRRVDRWAPAPGIMPTCSGCRHQDALRCRSPLLKANGGPGLPIRSGVAAQGFACSRKQGCCELIQYSRPAECDGREGA
jgi:hypothetical protein